MTVRKLGGSWWVDLRFEKKRYRRRSPDNSQAGAKAYEALLRSRLAQGAPLHQEPPPKTPTAAEFAPEWLATYVRANNRPSEQYHKKLWLKVHLLPAFGALPMDRVTSAHIEQFKASKLAVGLAPASINNFLLVFGKLLRTALEWGRIATVPRIKLLRVPPAPFDFLTSEESDRLLAATAESAWHNMVLVALRTGLRLSELAGLEWPDIDFERRALTVRRSRVLGFVSSPKNNRTRTIPLTNDAWLALNACRRPTGPVFLQSNGQPVMSSSSRAALHRLCSKAGLRAVGWHALRHSFASQLVSAGVPLRTVQDLMGHATIQMTVRYSHLTPSLLRQAVDVLDPARSRLPEDFGQQVGNDPKQGATLRTTTKEVELSTMPPSPRDLGESLNKKAGPSALARHGAATQTLGL